MYQCYAMQIITLAHEEPTLFVFFFISNSFTENILSIEINGNNVSFEILIKILSVTFNYLLEIL